MSRWGGYREEEQSVLRWAAHFLIREDHSGQVIVLSYNRVLIHLMT